jgi:hypothetical protein
MRPWLRAPCGVVVSPDFLTSGRGTCSLLDYFHLLGLDHKRLSYRDAGCDFWTDVHGDVVTQIIA